MLPKPIAAILLWGFFFAICLGLGYPTLNRYDPGAGNLDAAQYRKMVRHEEGVPSHFRHRILVPYLARPVFRTANGHVGSWDAAYFALLVVNSLFVSGTAFLLFVIATRIFTNTTLALLSAAVYLLNFAVPNLFLAALVDSAEAFFLLFVIWGLLAQRAFLLPVATIFGSLAKETFLPFALTLAITWLLVQRERSPKPWVWIAGAAATGLIALTAALSITSSHLLFPWTYAGALQSRSPGPSVAMSALADVKFWYVFAWLLPLGLFRLNRFRREWIVACAVTALLALALTAYHTSAPDAGAASARPIFSIAGPLLSCGAAVLLTDLAKRVRGEAN